MNLEQVKVEAMREIEIEDFRQAVAEYKKKLREKRSFWDRIFSWKILIVRKRQSL
jgi:predicted transcriptional regulator YdeE